MVTEELCRKLYCLSFSNEEEPGKVLVKIVDAFNEGMNLKKTDVVLKSADDYSVVASSEGHQVSANIRQIRYPIYSRGQEVGELRLLVGEKSKLLTSEEKLFKAFINQLADILDSMVPKEPEAFPFKEVSRYKRLLETDKLTGLSNRHHFEETIEIIKKEKQYPVSLIFVDVDGLKIINDYLGHTYGDLALKQTSELLKSAFRGHDLVARVGGDEFVILLPFTQRKSAEMRCKLLLDALKAYNQKGNIPPLSFSAGIAVTDGSIAVHDLLHLADKEMYKQKQKNALRYCNFLRSRCLAVTKNSEISLQQPAML